MLSDDQITQIRERLRFKQPGWAAYADKDIRDLLTLVDQLRQERDAHWADLCEVKAGSGVTPLALYDAAMERARIAEAACARLRTALEAYGKHPASCPKGTGIGYYKPKPDAVCDCGIDEALALPVDGGERSRSEPEHR